MDDEMMKKIAETARHFSEPLDLQKLIDDGLIIQKGKSYYLNCSPDQLPEAASRRINSIESNKNGVKVTFSKDTKSSINAARKLSGYTE